MTFLSKNWRFVLVAILTLLVAVLFPARALGIPPFLAGFVIGMIGFNVGALWNGGLL